MEKRSAWIFLAASAAFFVFIVGLTGYRIEDARRRNTEAARERVSRLAAMAASLREASAGLDTRAFAQGMRAEYDAEPRLLLLAVRSDAQGISYLAARHKSYLKEPAVVTPEWRGTPTYQVGRGYELLLSRPVGSSAEGTTLDALFVIMGREDLYPILRDDLYLFLAFLLVCGVFILIVTTIQQETEPAAPPKREAGIPPSSGTPRIPSAFVREEPRPAVTTREPPFQAEKSRRGDEQAVLQRYSADSLIESPASGLAWSVNLKPRLRAELERAASSDQDLVLARVLIDSPPAPDQVPRVHQGIAKILRESFPIHDLIFECEKESYAVILPDTDIDSAVGALEKFRKKVAESPMAGKKATVSVGASSRGGRLVEGGTLLAEAEVSVRKAFREGGDRVTGFRADPGKYRELLSRQRL